LGVALALLWTAVAARAGPLGEAVFSAGLVVGPLALGLAMPSIVPLVILGVTAFNLVFAFFLAWGIAGGDNPTSGPLAGVGCLAVALAWLAAVIGSNMLLDGAAPLGAPLLLLLALPILATAAAVRDARARGQPIRDSLWTLALFFLPPLLALWLHLAQHRA
jgi:hypothetical protein